MKKKRKTAKINTQVKRRCKTLLLGIMDPRRPQEISKGTDQTAPNHGEQVYRVGPSDQESLLKLKPSNKGGEEGLFHNKRKTI